MPSSLKRVLSRALGFSPHLPVSVYGTGISNLVSGFSRQCGVSQFATKFRSPSPLRFESRGFAYETPYRLGRTQPTVRCAYPSVSPHPSNGLSWYWNLNQLSIAYAIRLGLGPDLPWADEPSPGILRFSAGRILTCLIVYLYRHSHFLPVHSSLRYCFAQIRTLPYHSIVILNPKLRCQA